MILHNRVCRTISAVMALALLAATPVFAQEASEISESHLKAARQAVAAIRATEEFDGILPQAAAALRTELIQKNPDLQELVIKIVDEEALALAARRADLEREAAIAYARVFSEQELGEISGFYTSETGKKLLSDGPIVTRELFKAADIWQRGVARDLAENVGKKLEAIVESQAPAPDPGATSGEAPAGETAPAQ
jgi:hypothetical protein